MVILLLGLLFILNTAALTLIGIAYCSNSNPKKLLCSVLALTAVNILANALIFVVLYS